MSVLADLPNIVASALGNTLFKDITFQRDTRTSDGRGGFTSARTTFAARGVITEYSDFIRQQFGIPEDRRKLIVQGKDLTEKIKPQDLVAIDGQSWRVFKVAPVPTEAVFECQVGPDDGVWDIDLATTVTDDPELLASLGSTIASAASGVFGPITYYRQVGATSDGRGSYGRPKVPVQATGIVTEIMDGSPVTGGVSPDERIILIQSVGVDFEPIPGDIVLDDNGRYWVITRIDIVPGKAIYRFRASPTSAEAANIQGLTASAVITLDAFTVTGVGEITTITGSGGGSVEDMVLIGIGVLEIYGTATPNVDDFTSDAFGELSIESTGGGTLWAFVSGEGDPLLIGNVSPGQVDDFTSDTATSKTELGDGLATLDDFTLDATAAFKIVADGVFTLDAVTVSGSASQDNQGALSGQVEDFTMSGQADLQIEGALSVTLDSLSSDADGDPLIQGAGSSSVAMTMTGSATLSIEGTAALTLSPFVASGAGVLSLDGAGAGQVEDVTSTGSGSQALSGTLTATLDGFTSDASGAQTVTGSANLSLDAFTGTGQGDLDIIGSTNGTLSDFVVSGAATTSIEATGGGDIDAITVTGAAHSTIVGTLAETVADFTMTGSGTVSAAGPPTLDANVVMAWDPVGSGANAYGIGSHPDLTNYSLWPMDGSDGSVDTGWDGEFGATGATALAIDSADLDAAGILQAATAWSASFWIKRTSGTSYTDVFGYGGQTVSDAEENGVFSLRQEGAANNYNFAHDGQWDSGDSFSFGDDTTWEHFVISYRGDGYYRAYADGVQVASNDQINADFEVKDLGYVLAWAAGDPYGGAGTHGDSTWSNTRDWLGQIGDIRLYDKELNASEAAALHTAGRAEYAGQDAALYSAEATAYLARVTGTLSQTEQDALAALIDGLVDDGVWAKLDLFYLLAQNNATDAARNLISDTFNATIQGGLAFHPNSGVYGFSANNTQIATGFNPSTDGTNLTPTSATIGVYAHMNSGLGLWEASDTEAKIGGNPDLLWGWGDTSSYSPSFLTWDTFRSISSSMDGSNAYLYENGTQRDTQSLSGSTLSSALLYFGESYDDTRVRAAWAGGSLSQTETTALHNRLTTYFAAVGAYEDEAESLYTEFTSKPEDATRMGHINTLIKSMKDSGAWSKLDWFSIVGHTEQASLINWIVPTEEMTVNGDPAGVVVDSHYDTHDDDGSPSNSGWECAPASKSYALADITFGIYFKKLDENGETRASRLGDNQTFFRCDFSAPYGQVTGGGNFVNVYTPRVVNANYHMVYVHQGTGAADRIMYYNGASVDTRSGAGGSLNQSSNLEMGADNKNEDTHLLCGYIGTALTAQEVSDLHDAVEAYRIAIGA